MQELYEKIFYSFENESLLQEALTHPSATKNVNGKKLNYQRLEFLGDKVLSFVVSGYLIENFPDESEGELSRRHAFLVSGEVLSEIAKEIGLDDYLILSSGEQKSGGKERKSNLENALEALIGAIYLDSDIDVVYRFIMSFWKDLLDKDGDAPKDPVSKLQEIVQSKVKKLPQYEIVKSGGSDHEPEFEAILKVDDLNIEISAVGLSKKEAQKKVATLALEKIS